MGTIRSLSRIHEARLANFRAARKNEKERRKVAAKGERKRCKGDGDEDGGEVEEVSFVIPEYASNIYATPATMGTISVAWQPLSSGPVSSIQPAPSLFHSPSSHPPLSLFLSQSRLTHSLPLSAPLHPRYLSLLRLSPVFIRPLSHLIGRGTETRSD